MIEGRVWKYGDNVDTDVIIPGRYCHITDEAELARHCLEDLDPAFARNVRRGDILVAGENFGCGSSRELAPISIRAAGISVVIAKSFARIFFRNAINIGLPILESAEAAEEAQPGDTLRVDLGAGTIENPRTGSVHRAAPLPEFVQRIVAAGGLMNHLRSRMKDGVYQPR
jgi:3-isopropylmalate dehydratase small subunit